MGYFRFILALLVALSHATTLPINLGVSAVTGFYFLSGYLMTESISKFHKSNTNPKTAFYVDRFFRIFPIFWIMFSLSALWLYKNNLLIFNYKLLLEAALIPNNYYFTFKFLSDRVIEPSWSLGAEVQFYILIPFILLLSKKLQSILTITFLVGQIIALTMPYDIGLLLSHCTEYGWITCDGKISDLFGYRYLSFALGIFLLGSACRHWHMGCRMSKGIVLSTILTYYIFFFLVLTAGNLIKNIHTLPVTLGFLFFIPACLFFLNSHNAQLSFGKIDAYLGKLAYPLFLSHMLVISIIKFYLGDISVNTFFIPECLLCAILMSLLLYFIQSHIDVLRYKIRGFGRVTQKN